MYFHCLVRSYGTSIFLVLFVLPLIGLYAHDIQQSIRLPTFADFDINEDFNIDSVDIHSGGDDETGEFAEKLTSTSTLRAVALMRGPQTYGVVRFEQHDSGPTHLTGFVSGLYPMSQHGFHVHQYKVVGGNCESAGEHYNPTNQPHGGPNSPVSHVGDFGNLHSDAKGTSQIDLISDKVSLRGKYSIIGRSVVVHLRPDDLGTGYNQESRKSGNSGGRIACGTINFVSINKS
ncbi:hypothetical protein RDWZM_006981 [Blomia tropicalis]|uniref:Superoxide dismutase [Cu-Zn] n=1 Tax=Blomia tropicalis TaxID=40697 RepID=A0A9Q0RNV6_BLOTA|nr:Superoxide dismutase [Cu-Zn] [Blomia tropicalis]KAJ6221169.1 hypothetical protein RDWZM_006981 [Blomia tropicalis]